MATILLNWTPAGGANATSQLVQRKTSTTSFTTIATLSASADTYSDTTASDNVVYTYQVVTECAVGGPTDSEDVSAVALVCPMEVPVNVTLDEVSFDLPSLGGQDVVYQTVQIFDGSQISTHLETINQDGLYSFSVSGLAYNMNYTYTITIGAVGSSETLECTGSFATDPEPTCPEVTNLTATIA